MVVLGSGISAGLAAAPTGNAATDTATVNSAKAAGLQLQPGTYVINPIVMNTGDELIGSGWGTILQAANGTNAHLVTMSAQAYFWKIADVRFNGNKANQTAGDILHFDTSSYTAGDATPNDVQDDDPNPEIRHVALFDGYGNGLYIKGGRGAGMFHQIYSADNGGCGFDIEAPDNEFMECTAGNNGNQGFLVAPSGGNVRLMNCKSFLSGRVGGKTLGAGFDIQNVARVDAVNCSAQDNRGHGFSVVGSNQVKISGISERNGLGLSPDPLGGNGDGIYLSGTVNSDIRLVCGDRNVSGVLCQRYGYNFAGSGNTGIFADIVIDSATTSGQAGTGTLGAGSTLRGTYQGATFGGTVPLPTGNAGKFLTTDGTTTSWGTPAGSGGGQIPSDSPLSQGFSAWPYDAVLASGFSSLNNGGWCDLSRMVVQQATTSNGFYFYVNAAAAGTTSGSTGAILVNSSGTIIASATSASVEAQITSTGLKNVAWVTPVALTAGQIVYIGMWFNGTTGPQLGRQGTVNPANTVPSGTTRRFGSVGPYTTAAPPSVTLTSMGAPASALFWYAV